VTGAATSSSARRGLTDRIRDEAERLGFEAVGCTSVRHSDHAAFYRAWIEAGRHGEMAYLARPDAIEARTDPASRWPELRSAIVVALRYYGDGDAHGDGNSFGGGDGNGDGPGESSGNGDGYDARDPSRAIIARYARGRDYHKVLKQKLLALLAWLEQEVGHALPAARAYVDTGPVLERELARRAGLGWFGRNTMLLHPRRGSYFFLGALLTELDLEPDEPFERDHCGTCNACVEACPTGALLGRDATGAPVIDATRCISYLTIEHRGPIPRALRPLIGNRVFGCDICQEVCPFTRKSSAPAREPSFAARGTNEPAFGVQLEPGAARPHPGTRSPSLIALLETALDPSAWDAFTRGSALRRAGRAGLARNVCVGLGNWGSPEAVPVLTSALADPDPLVRGHAAWALGRISSPSAVSALEQQAGHEPDPWVSEEISAALAS